MSEVDMVTVSSRGQVSIPAAVRRELDIEAGAKLLVVSKGDNILLKKVDKSVVERSLKDVLEPMWDQAADAGLSDDDAEALIDDHRDET